MAPDHPLEGWRILVVEDDFLVAQFLCEWLADQGAIVVGPAGWLEDALPLVNEPLNVAVLDLNLHGAKSYPVADALLARSVPFVFTSGYGIGAVEAKYAGHPQCQKPIATTALLALLRQAGAGPTEVPAPSPIGGKGPGEGLKPRPVDIPR